MWKGPRENAADERDDARCRTRPNPLRWSTALPVSGGERSRYAAALLGIVGNERLRVRVSSQGSRDDIPHGARSGRRVAGAAHRTREARALLRRGDAFRRAQERVGSEADRVNALLDEEFGEVG